MTGHAVTTSQGAAADRAREPATEPTEPTERPAFGARRSWRWRGTYAAAVVLAATALVTGLGSATLTGTGSGSGSASSGSVTFGTPTVRTCSYSSLLPGDLVGSATCVFAVSYSGSLPTYLSLTIQIRSAAGPGGTPLYDGTNTTGLTFTLSDGHVSYTIPTGPGTTGGTCQAGYTCWTAQNDLAAWYSAGTPNLTFASGKSVTFTVTPRFPKSAGNAYQGGTATVTLIAQAVQATSNPLPPGCTPSTTGQPCPATGTFTWN